MNYQFLTVKVGHGAAVHYAPRSLSPLKPLCGAGHHLKTQKQSPVHIVVAFEVTCRRCLALARELKP